VTVVIGVGNRWRSDDGAGLEAAALLAAEPGATVHEHDGDGTGLLDLWAGADAVVLIDAIRGGAAPGDLHRLDASDAPLPRPAAHRSSHALGVAEAIELSRALGSLPGRVVVCGVEGASFAAGRGLSPAVADRIPVLASMVRDEVRMVSGGMLGEPSGLHQWSRAPP
jgi:hydrogenase maturation protease